jgi:hypothetical protein
LARLTCAFILAMRARTASTALAPRERAGSGPVAGQAQ